MEKTRSRILGTSHKAFPFYQFSSKPATAVFALSNFIHLHSKCSRDWDNCLNWYLFKKNLKCIKGYKVKFLIVFDLINNPVKYQYIHIAKWLAQGHLEGESLREGLYLTLQTPKFKPFSPFFGRPLNTRPHYSTLEWCFLLSSHRTSAPNSQQVLILGT